MVLAKGERKADVLANAIELQANLACLNDTNNAVESYIQFMDSHHQTNHSGFQTNPQQQHANNYDTSQQNTQRISLDQRTSIAQQQQQRTHSHSQNNFQTQQYNRNAHNNQQLPATTSNQQQRSMFSNNNMNIICYHCNAIGHIARNCTLRITLNHQQRSRSQQNTSPTRNISNQTMTTQTQNH